MASRASSPVSTRFTGSEFCIILSNLDNRALNNGPGKQEKNFHN